MSSHRLSTVYDYSSLRIHPDGSRVNQSSHNLRPRIARVSVQDSRGNWIARDAGGSTTVAKYRKVRDEAPEGEHFDFGDVGSQDSGSGSHRNNKGKGKAKEVTVDRRKRNGRSAAKRQKFFHDFEFLATQPQLDGPPLPSSDLLKCIHYFASTYYNERGQLFNGSREFRQQRKQNKLMKLQQEKEARSASTSSRGTPDDDDSQMEEVTPKTPRRGGRVKGAGKVIHRKDMYKVLDGSALMVIGMLLQEYVADMLEVRIPEGWEESIRNAYGQVPDQHPNGDGDKDEDEDEDEDRETHISDGSESEDKASEEESEDEEDSGDDYKP